MKTIEERIKQLAIELTPCGVCQSDSDGGGCKVKIEDCAFYKDIYNALTEIAKLQQEIDINKAFEIYEKELRELKRLFNESAGVAGNLISVGESLSRIRLEMLSSTE